MPNWFTCGVVGLYVLVNATVAYVALDTNSFPLKVLAVVMVLAGCVAAFRVGRHR